MSDSLTPGRRPHLLQTHGVIARPAHGPIFHSGQGPTRVPGGGTLKKLSKVGKIGQKASVSLSHSRGKGEQLPSILSTKCPEEGRDGGRDNLCGMEVAIRVDKRKRRLMVLEDSA